MNVADMLAEMRGWRRDPPRPWRGARYREYREYLDSPAWWAARGRAFAALGHACQGCGRQGRLEVHHKHYRTLGHERPEDLMVLCKFCHEKMHRRRGRRA